MRHHTCALTLLFSSGCIGMMLVNTDCCIQFLMPCRYAWWISIWSASIPMSKLGTPLLAFTILISADASCSTRKKTLVEHWEGKFGAAGRQKRSQCVLLLAGVSGDVFYHKRHVVFTWACDGCFALQVILTLATGVNSDLLPEQLAVLGPFSPKVTLGIYFTGSFSWTISDVVR